eukprot:293448_1
MTLQPTGSMDAEGDPLRNFLSSCLKQAKHVTEVENKLKEEGIDYETIFELGEDDLRATLRDGIKIKPWHVGLIINKLRDMDDSGVAKYSSSSASGSIVVLTP